MTNPPIRVGAPFADWLYDTQAAHDHRAGTVHDPIHQALANAAPRSDGSRYIRLNDEQAERLSFLASCLYAITDGAPFDDHSAAAERRSAKACMASIHRRNHIVSNTR